MDPMQTPFPPHLTALAIHATGGAASGLAATQAENLAEMRVVPPVQPPELTDCVLCDHKQTLSLFSQLFRVAKAAAGAEAASEAAAAADSALRISAGALAMDLLLHSQAENVVLFPLLANRRQLVRPTSDGAGGKLLARNAERAEAELDKAAADLLRLLHNGRGQSGGELREAILESAERLQEVFMAHQQEEEATMLPRIAAALNHGEQRRLAAEYVAAKQHAHPVLLVALLGEQQRGDGQGEVVHAGPEESSPADAAGQDVEVVPSVEPQPQQQPDMPQIEEEAGGDEPTMFGTGAL